MSYAEAVLMHDPALMIPTPGESKTAAPLRVGSGVPFFGKPEQTMAFRRDLAQSHANRRGGAAGMLPHFANITTGRGAGIGALIGGGLGLINPGTDDEGDTRSRLGAGLGGALTGAALGGAAGHIGRKTVVDPALRTEQAAQAPHAGGKKTVEDVASHYEQTGQLPQKVKPKPKPEQQEQGLPELQPKTSSALAPGPGLLPPGV
mgnify:CR=1 FL=1